jgi:hypothetical protein
VLVDNGNTRSRTAQRAAGSHRSPRPKTKGLMTLKKLAAAIG